MSDSAENAASLLAGLDRGESLPARWYTDPAITEREIHRIFRRTWNYIGPLNELQKIGDYITGYVGEIPVVVLRNESRACGAGQCLPASPPRGHERPRQRPHDAVRLSRLDLRSERLPEERAAHGARSRASG